MAINSLTPQTKGFSGLVSGMDTQTMVDQMLKGTQSKIDAKNQQKAVLAYKQGMYRDIATRIKTFQNTFFSFTKAETNLMSNALFQSMNAVSDSKFFTAKATSNASSGKLVINSIDRLASNHKEISTSDATGALAGIINDEAFKKLQEKITSPTDSNITFTIGEDATLKTIDVAMSDLVGKSTNEAVDIINAALKAGGATNTTADFINGKVQLTNTDGEKINVQGGKNLTGVVSGVAKADGSASFSFDAKAVLPKINVNVDGINRTLSFNPMDVKSGEDSGAAIARQLNEGLKSAFGSGVSFQYDNAKKELSLTTTSATSKVTLTGEKDVMTSVGIKSGLSNKLSLTTSISDVNFKTPISGSIQKFSINGVDFSFSTDTSISNIIADINSSDAGVKITYDANRDRFAIESTTSGKKIEPGDASLFKIEQTEGNLMTAMFGVSSSKNFSSEILSKSSIDPTATFKNADFKFEGGFVSFAIKDGDKTKEYSVFVEKSATPEEFITNFNKEVAKTPELMDVDGKPKVSFDMTAVDASGNRSITIKAQDAGVAKTVNITNNGLETMGFTNKVSESSKLSELGFENFSFEAGGKTINVNANTTLGDFLRTIEAEAGPGATAELKTIGTTPFIRLAGVEIPMKFTQPAASKLFGADIQPGDGKTMISNLSYAADDGGVLGQDAVATINGKEVSRATNTFTIDGVTLTLTGTTSEEQTVSVSQNTDQIFDAVKKFTEEYNKLVNEVNSMLDAPSTYKKYPPLTQEQKNAMNEKEVELWESKSKEGLLRGDSTLQSIMTSLRGTLYTKPDEGGLALYDLGITTDYFGTKDNLAIKDEAALKQKISENPDAVRKLFTDAEKGLSVIMNQAMDKAASTGTKAGSLVQMAGSTGVPDTQSAIYRQMKMIDSSLDNLNVKYKSEYDRYWRQFNNMEQQLAKMQQQSGWLSQQFA